MARLDIEKQKELEPKRMEYAIEQITKFGYEISFKNDSQINFVFKHQTVYFFPYSGWYSGKSIISGRGIDKLLKQIKQP